MKRRKALRKKRIRRLSTEHLLPLDAERELANGRIELHASDPVEIQLSDLSHIFLRTNQRQKAVLSTQFKDIITRLCLAT